MRRLPGARVKKVAQLLHRVPDVNESHVERREAEAEYPGLAIVADHAAGDQRLHHRIAVRMDVTHLASAPLVRKWGHESESPIGAALFRQCHEQIAQRKRFTPQRRHVGALEDLQTAFHQRGRDDRLRAA